MVHIVPVLLLSPGQQPGEGEGVRDPRMVLLREFVQCQLMVQRLGAAEESYTRSAVEVSVVFVTLLTDYDDCPSY